MKLFQVLAIAIGLILVTWRPVAQADTAATPTFEQLQIQIAILKDQINVLQRENAEFRKKTFAADRDLYGALVELKKKEYAYYGDLMDINVQAFHAQKIASYIVLLLVLIVVVAGILFSGFQLWKSVSVAGVQSNSDLEISASKVRVTSSVVGVVVLAISLAFLFVYAHEVYQIKTIRTIDTAQSQQAPDAAKSN